MYYPVVNNHIALYSERERVQILCTGEYSEDIRYEFQIEVGTYNMSK
jgi:hypothetical protein